MERVWAYYIEKLGKNPKLTSFTAGRKQKGLARLRECLEKTGGDLARAEALMRVAVDALAASAFHCGDNDRKKRYDSWEGNLFRSQEQLEKWLEGHVASAPAQKRHPELDAVGRAEYARHGVSV